MEDEWDNTCTEKVVPVIANNKWEGEDDDNDVKDSWEDEEEKRDEEKVESTKVVSPAKTKSKALKTKQERVEEEKSDMSQEDKLAEKLRLQKVQQESDLNFALETFGLSSVGLDNLNPQSKEEFKEFGEKLTSRISQYRESTHFAQFVEELIRNICVNLTAADIKKVKICVETLHSEKLKMEKQNKKPASKGKLKINLRTETDDIEGFTNYQDDYDDVDDFM